MTTEVAKKSSTHQKNVSKRIVEPVLKYLDAEYGSAITEKILEDIKLDRLYFEDVDGFMPLETTENLFSSAKFHTGDNDFPYTMGRNLIKFVGPLQGLIACTFASPSIIFLNCEKVEQKLVKTTCVKTTRLGPNKFHLKISFKDNYREPPSACRNRHGSYEAIPTFFGLPYARVEHPKCAFRGDPNCEYIVTLPEAHFHWFFKGVIVAGAVSLVSAVIWLFTKSHVAAGMAGVFLPASLVLHILFIQSRFVKTKKWVKDAVETINKTTKQLQIDGERTRQLHELTVELNRNIHIGPICKKVTHLLVNDFTYDAAQVWITGQGDRLYCAGVYGYDEKVTKTIFNMQYSISEGLQHPDGFVVKVLKNKETLLLNDFVSATKNFTEQSQHFFAFLDVSSVIIIPLFDGNDAFGMLVGVNKGQKKVSYIDKILFEALTHIVSNSLLKARLYERMETKIRKRDEEIRRRQEQVILAKEMTIQNEKLSALGQMAAGIAHEINNPLNFLFNIFPDLRQDFEGLEKVVGVLDEHLIPEDKGIVKELADQFQLNTHLSEIDEVFTYINKALDKARKTANSLKVFARSADKEEMRPEQLDRVIEQAVELIPAKYLSGVELQIDIPAGIEITVNRIEFQQVIISLLRNALEASDNCGKVKISSSINKENVLIAIEDNGSGIAKEYGSAIFRPFFTTKDPQQHTGLGLTIAREIVKKYGGDLTYNSKPQGGTVFTLALHCN